MKRYICLSIALAAQFSSALADVAASSYESLQNKLAPTVTVFISSSAKRYEINGKMKGSIDEVKAEIKRIIELFGPELPLSLVVSGDTKLDELEDFIRYSTTCGGYAVRVFVSSDVVARLNNHVKSGESDFSIITGSGARGS